MGRPFNIGGYRLHGDLDGLGRVLVYLELKDILVRLVYLWTRDGEITVDQEGEEYVRKHLAGLDLEPQYCDSERQAMAERLAKETGL